MVFYALDKFQATLIIMQAFAGLAGVGVAYGCPQSSIVSYLLVFFA